MGQLISAINMFVRLKNQIEAYLWFNCTDHGSTNAKEQTRMEKANNINWHISPFAQCPALQINGRLSLDDLKDCLDKVKANICSFFLWHGMEIKLLLAKKMMGYRMTCMHPRDLRRSG